MPFFTARNRQNAFAERRRRQQAEGQRVVADAPESSPESPNPKPVQMAAPFHAPEDADLVETPDIATLATGGIVELPAEVDEDSPTPLLPDAEDVEREATTIAVEISAETQAKIDAVMNHAVPPVADERPDHPGPRGAEHMRPLTESEPVADEPKRGRGRPRPQETIDRDNAVHALLAAADDDAGVSKEALAIALDEKEQQVYSSLRKLSKEGRAKTKYVKGHGYRWFAL